MPFNSKTVIPAGPYLCTFSKCRTWRYSLTVSIVPLLKTSHYVTFIGLNPSTADERELDPTVRRCAGYAKLWGYDAMVMTNLFAFRATDPRVMQAAEDPVGPDNDNQLFRLTIDARMVVCAWGVGGEFKNRGKYVEKMLRGTGVALYCIEKTREGFPAHPLYLRKDLRPKPY